MFGITNEMLYRFLIRAMVLFTAMPVHECAHGLVADRLGDDTARSQGRLTLNPFAHLDWTGSLLLFFTGFGWARPVPVDTRNFKNPRRDMALTSFAGPASNILMALLLMTAFKLFLVFLPAMRYSSAMNSLVEILSNIIFINISLAILNMLPVPPLDGSKILASILPEPLYNAMFRYQQQISLVLMLLLFFGILTGPLMWLSTRVFILLDLVTEPIEALMYR